MSILDTTLHIPAERSYPGGPSRALERVKLPLASRVSMRFYAAAGMVAFVAVACLAMAAELATGTVRGDVDLTLVPVFVLAAILPAGVALTAFADARKRGPVLVVDEAGVFDRRLGDGGIFWDEIAAAELVGSSNGINAVRLVLAADGPARFNPFRIGGWSADWHRRRRVRLIALMLLDARAHTLAHTILALAARHGASIDAGPVRWTELSRL